MPWCWGCWHASVGSGVAGGRGSRVGDEFPLEDGLARGRGREKKNMRSLVCEESERVEFVVAVGEE